MRITTSRPISTVMLPSPAPPSHAVSPTSPSSSVSSIGTKGWCQHCERGVLLRHRGYRISGQNQLAATCQTMPSRKLVGHNVMMPREIINTRSRRETSMPSSHRASVGFHDRAPQPRIAQQIRCHPIFAPQSQMTNNFQKSFGTGSLNSMGHRRRMQCVSAKFSRYSAIY